MKTKYPAFQNVVVVHPEKCTGCTYCEKDCPYQAIEMRERPPGEKFKQIAFVISRRCAECGVCVGACPFAAIEFPLLTDRSMEARIDQALAPAPGRPGPEGRMVVFLCEWSVAGDGLLDGEGRLRGIEEVYAVLVPCTGMIKPAWVERVLRVGAEAAVVCGCPIGDCHYREGNLFSHDRLVGERPPRLKTARIDVARLGMVWLSAGEQRALVTKLQAFRQRLGQRPRPGAAAPT